MIGTSSSLASALSARQISETSSWRLSHLALLVHQLEVVDDDQPQPRILLLEAPRLGAQVERREPARVVDVDAAR